jgi:hypothetical protein
MVSEKKDSALKKVLDSVTLQWHRMDSVPEVATEMETKRRKKGRV